MKTQRGLLIIGGRGRCQGRLPSEVDALASLMMKNMGSGASCPGPHQWLIILWASYLTSLSLLPCL